MIFFSFSVNIGPYGSESLKTLLLQIADEIFKLFLNFLRNGPHKTMFGIFEIFKTEILMIYFSFSLTWDLVELKFQNATPPTKCSSKFSNFYRIIFSVVLTKVCFGIF